MNDTTRSSKQRVGQRKTFVRSFLAGCQRAYGKAKASLGQPKRQLVVYRVEHARDGLEDAKAQFQTTLDKFSGITHFEGGGLEDKYRQLRVELEHSQAVAKAVQDRIRSVEEVAEALFDEWQTELEQFASRSLRSSSRQKLKSTRQHYGRLIKAMHRAEAKIHPVLAAFKDQVLFLKHNLNAQAIASLRNDMLAVGIDIAALIGAMEKSIFEANAFVNSLADQKALPSGPPD